MDRTRYFRASGIDWLVKGLLALHVEADIAMKEKSLARIEAPDTRMRRFLAPHSLMRFLQRL